MSSISAKTTKFIPENAKNLIETRAIIEFYFADCEQGKTEVNDEIYQNFESAEEKIDRTIASFARIYTDIETPQAPKDILELSSDISQISKETIETITGIIREQGKVSADDNRINDDYFSRENMQSLNQEIKHSVKQIRLLLLEHGIKLTNEEILPGYENLASRVINNVKPNRSSGNIGPDHWSERTSYEANILIAKIRTALQAELSSAGLYRSYISLKLQIIFEKDFKRIIKELKKAPQNTKDVLKELDQKKEHIRLLDPMFKSEIRSLLRYLIEHKESKGWGLATIKRAQTSKVMAVELLGTNALGGEPIIEYLRSLLNSTQDISVRLMAAYSLAEEVNNYGDETKKKNLEELNKMFEAETSDQAKRTLGNIINKLAGETLIDLYEFAEEAISRNELKNINKEKLAPIDKANAREVINVTEEAAKLLDQRDKAVKKAIDVASRIYENALLNNMNIRNIRAQLASGFAEQILESANIAEFNNVEKNADLIDLSEKAINETVYFILYEIENNPAIVKQLMILNIESKQDKIALFRYLLTIRAYEHFLYKVHEKLDQDELRALAFERTRGEGAMGSQMEERGVFDASLVPMETELEEKEKIKLESSIEEFNEFLGKYLDRWAPNDSFEDKERSEDRAEEAAFIIEEGTRFEEDKNSESMQSLH
ncbi:MAG: hypothetical protein ABIA04_03880 [Pseudomonadota bacterium]